MEAARILRMKNAQLLQPSYLSTRLRTYLSEPNVTATEFKPFIKERDELNRLIDNNYDRSRMNISGNKNDLSVTQLKKNLKKIQNTSSGSNIKMNTNDECNMSATKTFSMIFKKKEIPIKCRKKRTLPIIKLKVTLRKESPGAGEYDVKYPTKKPYYVIFSPLKEDNKITVKIFENID